MKYAETLKEMFQGITIIIKTVCIRVKNKN